MSNPQNERSIESAYLMSAEQQAERAKAMYDMYTDAEHPRTLREVGKQFGITREGVRFVLRKHGYPTRNTGETMRLFRTAGRRTDV